MAILNSNTIREVHLDELGKVARQLCQEVACDSFQPDCLVYLETGARLLAVEFCNYFDVGGLALTIQRKSMGLKGRLAWFLACLPKAARDALRRLEGLSTCKRPQSRRTLVTFPTVDLSNKRVLIVDDAVDTGTSARMARDWAAGMGARPQDIKIAAVTSTTSLANDLVDYCLYREMCRFPWSSDSEELPRYRQIFQHTSVPPYQQRQRPAGTVAAIAK
jgi:hypoxanthine phosphoribosyltransferase